VRARRLVLRHDANTHYHITLQIRDSLFAAESLALAPSPLPLPNASRGKGAGRWKSSFKALDIDFDGGLPPLLAPLPSLLLRIPEENVRWLLPPRVLLLPSR